PYTPLQHLPQAKASFAVYNSPLTETAVLGFEYGYSVHAPDALVLWEAQFGDFANVAQTIIDQFLMAARAKWRQQPALVLLLPHGYEGQGPEHSSARLERYLQLAAEDNVRIANCTTAAQYFHLLRLQAATLGSGAGSADANDGRPLVVMTPKRLLRQPKAASTLDALSEDRFHPVLLDQWEDDPARVERLLLCSGKVAVDLIAAAEKAKQAPTGVAMGRVELLYPFPDKEIARITGRFTNLREVVWVQEEPKNMGAWLYVTACLPSVLPAGISLHYVGRPARASTAEGSPEVHACEQARIVEEALAGKVPAGA
ncbi:MAG: 2-oxoglutarate dehydrogenase E1 component, partial [Chloroflexota bacterium]|nr:2-oxoglutarate dehydrogenase E1 component [Chloroflexota bacterium]